MDTRTRGVDTRERGDHRQLSPRAAGTVVGSSSASMTTTMETGPRERAAHSGIEWLGDAELIAVVLGTGYAGMPVGVLAAELLEEHGGVGGLARMGIGELTERPGLGTAKGARLAAAIELGRRATFAASLAATPKLPDGRAVE